MNDMTKLSLTGKLLLFADDTVLFHSDTCVNTLYSNVQKDLDSVLNWCSFNKLCINSKKLKQRFLIIHSRDPLSAIIICTSVVKKSLK